MSKSIMRPKISQEQIALAFVTLTRAMNDRPGIDEHAVLHMRAMLESLEDVLQLFPVEWREDRLRLALGAIDDAFAGDMDV